MSDYVKIGVVGLGRGIDLANSCDGKKGVLHAICDINPERFEVAKESFKRHNVKCDNLLCFDNYDDLLKSDIDAVIIATEISLHTPMAIKALNAGKHVLSEIPTIGTLEDAKNLKEAVAAHPELKYMAGENCCFWGFIHTWKHMYKKGLLGKAVFAESEYLHHLYYDPAIGGRPPVNRAIDENGNPTWRARLNSITYLTHNLGPLLYILDDKCVSVTCFTPELKYEHKPDYITGAKDQVAIFRTEKGSLIKIFIGSGVNVGHDHNFTIYGERGTLETDRNNDFHIAHTFARLADFPNTEGKIDIPVATPFPDYERPRMPVGSHGGADAKMVEVFADCILNNTESPLDVDAGIQMSIAGKYAEMSAKQGGISVEIPTKF
ncbi:MAG: Gfo/Idh/MocA family oxidoreductase [Ruminococcaceae bacterium]|nr:Gfo/Idh/MocA family oxidoreductase [Oscillospiraceae bacterium]